MKNKFIVILLIVTILLGTFETYYVFATTKKELNNQNSALDDKISSKKEEIEEIEQNLSEAMQEVQTLVTQISTYEQAIADLNSKIETVTAQITQTENNIAQKEKDIAEKQDLLNKRLIAIYESGNTSYLDMLLTSSDLSDFLSKYYLISEIAEYDANLITSLRTAKAELEAAKVQLETDKQSIENAKAEQVEKQNALKQIKAEKDAKVATLSSEEKALESELQEFENDKKAIQAELAAIAKREAEEAARNNQSYSIEPSACGYIFPVQGLSRGNIANTRYPSYPGHSGIDVNINVRGGKNVVAVKAGTVTTSKAMGGRIKNYGTDGNYVGSYSSYGEYVVINHHDGTMTLYGHMQPGSRRVSPGQSVSQGQVIGVVGNTGNVQPRPTPSSPLNGTHLHFEVLVGGRPVNPMQYLP